MERVVGMGCIAISVVVFGGATIWHATKFPLHMLSINQGEFVMSPLSPSITPKKK